MKTIDHPGTGKTGYRGEVSAIWGYNDVLSGPFEVTYASITPLLLLCEDSWGYNLKHIKSYCKKNVIHVYSTKYSSCRTGAHSFTY